jgi:cytochrome c oxidase subunit II
MRLRRPGRADTACAAQRSIRPSRARLGRGPSPILRSALIVGMLLLLAACGRTDIADFPQDALSPDGPIARQQDALWQQVFPIAVGVFVLVQALIIIAMVKFRARGDETELPRQFAGNTRLEIFWTLIPALILVWVAVPTVQTIFALAEEPAESERLDVRVVGKQYWWQFEYPTEGVLTANEMVIPTGTPVWVELDGIGEYEVADGSVRRDANLVLHSFWVPRLAGKLDYVPNHERFLTIQADEPGTYRGQCAEFCGLSHANMRFYVTALEPAEYEEWVAQQTADAREPQTAQEQLGYDLVGANCVGCHAINGHDANLGERVGPSLSHFASREEFAGAIFSNDDTEQLKAWINNPQAEKPGAQMPAFPNLTDEELEAIAVYLQSLE